MEDSSEFGATWHAAALTLPAAGPSLSFDLDVDVCVVGGGIAGLTVAREMARRGASVALIEARRLAWNASGRNCGVVAPGFPAPIEKIIERVGLPTAKDLWGQSETGVALLRGSLAELGLTEEGQGWLDVSQTPDTRAALTRVALINEEFRGAVEAWPRERVREVLKTRHYYHAVHFPHAFQINPLAYALALASAAQRDGAHIFEDTRAVTLDPAGIRKRIVTAKGQLRVAHVVLAGNIHLGAIAPRLADTLVPITRYVGVTRPIGRRIFEAVKFKGAVSDSRHANYRYRIVGDDRLLWSGDSFFARGVGSYGELLCKRQFHRAILSIYPQLQPVELQNVWSAETGLAIHRMPQIGEVQSGVWLASGFGGHGLHTATLAGHLIARAIFEADDTWRQFLPYELVWAGGRAGRIMVRTISWGAERLDAMRARAARERDARRERRRRIAAGLPPEPPRPAYKIMDAKVMDATAMGVPRESAVHAPMLTLVETAVAADGVHADPQPASPVSVIEQQAEPAPAVPQEAEQQTDPGEFGADGRATSSP